MEASKWLKLAANSYRVAAEHGDLDAQRWLGLAYKTGDGVERNLDESAKWYRKVADSYRKSAEQGDARAQASLASCYSLGEGVLQNQFEANNWDRRAAAQGDSIAQYGLGLKYYDGNKGVPKDFVQAYMWFNLSAARGDSVNPSEYWRDKVAAEMSPAQIAEAQRLAHEFKPRKEILSGNSSSPENSVASGTGFFITDDGYLITNEHVVKEAAQVRLVTSAGIIAARVVKVDAANDLALLKAEGRFAALPVVASRAMRLGSTVATVGFPNVGLQGFAPKLARGDIAALSGAQDDARHFQISVPVQPGNSGVALVDERGNVVGVVSAKLSARAALAASGALPENVNYAVKSSFLLSFLESVPEVSAKLKEARTAERKFEDVVKDAEQAAVLVLVY